MSQNIPGYQDSQMRRQSNINTGCSEKNVVLRFLRVNSNGATKTTLNDSTKWETLLHQSQEWSPQMHISNAATNIGRQARLQTHSIQLPGK